jgi:predicted hotdog family 3-hydroxylacyl-ACP dehydratase
MSHPPIAALVPQSGTMCLLDEIVSFDGRAIVCRASSHRSPGNPLRCDGRLSAFAGIEYGAQAMAVHGALQEQQPGLAARNGLLAGARAVRCNAQRLDDQEGALTVRAERLVQEGNRLLYSFVVEGAQPQRELVSGRIAVVLVDAPR